MDVVIVGMSCNLNNSSNLNSFRETLRKNWTIDSCPQPVSGCDERPRFIEDIAQSRSEIFELVTKSVSAFEADSSETISKEHYGMLKNVIMLALDDANIALQCALNLDPMIFVSMNMRHSSDGNVSATGMGISHGRLLPFLNSNWTEFTKFACSSSLTAIHLARLAIESGETNLAIIAGINHRISNDDRNEDRAGINHRISNDDRNEDAIESDETNLAIIAGINHRISKKNDDRNEDRSPLFTISRCVLLETDADDFLASEGVAAIVLQRWRNATRIYASLVTSDIGGCYSSLSASAALIQPSICKLFLASVDPESFLCIKMNDSDNADDQTIKLSNALLWSKKAFDSCSKTCTSIIGTIAAVMILQDQSLPRNNGSDRQSNINKYAFHSLSENSNLCSQSPCSFEKKWHKTFDLQQASYSYLTEHRIRNAEILPATFSLAVLWELASAEFSDDSFTFSDIEFLFPIYYSTEKPVQLIVKLISNVFTILHDDIICVRTTVILQQSIRSAVPMLINPDIISKQSFYSKMKTFGYEYGTNFQSITRVSVEESACLASLVMREDATTQQRLTLLLDAVLQAAVFIQPDTMTRQLLVPFFVGQFSLEATNGSNGYFSCATFNRDILAANASLYLVDICIATFKNIRFRPLENLWRRALSPVAGKENIFAGKKLSATDAGKENILAGKKLSATDVVIQYLTETFGLSCVDLNVGFMSLGLNSLQMIQFRDHLQTYCEQFGVHLSPTSIFDYPNVLSLSHYIERLIEPAPILSSSFHVTPLPGIFLHQNHADIGVVAVSCRLPGGAHRAEEFWDLLKSGRSCAANTGNRFSGQTNTVTHDRAYYANLLSNPIEQFDAAFFGLSKSEAEGLDPQQRLLLECVLECMENAGLCSLDDTGFFVGYMGSEYERLLIEQNCMGSLLGTLASAVAGRLNHFFGSQGPSIVLDTACSSSLVALDVAVESLRNRKCTLAIAAGVSLALSFNGQIQRNDQGLLSSDGNCRSFDGAADGYGRSEGCVVVLLRRLEPDEDGGSILGIIEATRINHDGPSASLTSPNGLSQFRLVSDLVTRLDDEDSGIDQSLNNSTERSEISYWEAHGTGTAIGDPVEANNLARFFHSRPIVLGSVKTSIGHGEAVSGITGILRVLLQLRYRTIPGHLHFNRLNSNIDFGKCRLAVVSEDWHGHTAGVSSFGISGTNAMALIRAPDAEDKHVLFKTRLVSNKLPHFFILPLSAKCSESLKKIIIAYERFLYETDSNYYDICASAAIRRCHHNHRSASILCSFQTGKISFDISSAQPISKNPSIGLIFGNVGSTYGYDLYMGNKIFQQSILRCSYEVHRRLGVSLVAYMYENSQISQFKTELLLLAKFSYFYALGKVWQTWILDRPALGGTTLFGQLAAFVLAEILLLNEAIAFILTISKVTDQDDDLFSILSAFPFNFHQPKFLICADVERRSNLAKALANVPEFLEKATVGFDSRDISIICSSDKTWSQDRSVYCVDDAHSIMQSISKVYIFGVNFDWNKIYDDNRPKILLPNYEFTRERLWFKKPSCLDFHPTIGRLKSQDGDQGTFVFTKTVNKESFFVLPDVNAFNSCDIQAGVLIECLTATCNMIAHKMRFNADSIAMDSFEYKKMLASQITEFVQLKIMVEIDKDFIVVRIFVKDENVFKCRVCFKSTDVPIVSLLEENLIDNNDFLSTDFYNQLRLNGLPYKPGMQMISYANIATNFVRLIPVNKSVSVFRFEAAFQLLAYLGLSIENVWHCCTIISIYGNIQEILYLKLGKNDINEEKTVTLYGNDRTVIAELRLRECSETPIENSTMRISQSRSKPVNANKNDGRKVHDICKQIWQALEDVIINEVCDKDPNLGFVELGLDSLSLLEFVLRLNRKYFPGAELSTTDIFAHSNVTKLARLIDQRLRDSVGDSTSEKYLHSETANFNPAHAYQIENERFGFTGVPDFYILFESRGCHFKNNIIICVEQPILQFVCETNTFTLQVDRSSDYDYMFKNMVKRQLHFHINLIEEMKMEHLTAFLLNFLKSAIAHNIHVVISLEECSSPFYGFVDGFLKAAVAERHPQIKYHSTFRLVKLEQLSVVKENDDETWLITGGLSGIGFEMGDWLTQCRKIHMLILVGRRPISNALLPRLNLMKQRTIVQIFHVDIAEFGQVEVMFKELNVNINGIIHSAGVVHDASIVDQNLQIFDRVMRPKIKGFENLCELTRNHDLRYFIVNSSVSSVFGHIGQCNYAAVNGYLDAAIRKRRSSGLCGTAINWGNWDKIGMAVDQNKWLESIGFKPISISAGLACLQHVLKYNPIQILYADMNPNLITKFRPDLTEIFNESNPTFLTENKRLITNKAIIVPASFYVTNGTEEIAGLGRENFLREKLETSNEAIKQEQKNKTSQQEQKSKTSSLQYFNSLNKWSVVVNSNLFSGHRINKAIIVPASFYVETLLYFIKTNLNLDRIEMRRLTFSKQKKLLENEEACFVVEKNERSVNLMCDGISYATCKFDDTFPFVEHINFDYWNNSKADVDVEAFYATLSYCGLDYSDDFRMLQTVTRGSFACVATLTAGKHGLRNIIEGVFQALLAIVFDQEKLPAFWIPVQIEEIRFYEMIKFEYDDNIIIRGKIFENNQDIIVGDAFLYDGERLLISFRRLLGVCTTFKRKINEDNIENESGQTKISQPLKTINPTFKRKINEDNIENESGQTKISTPLNTTNLTKKLSTAFKIGIVGHSGSFAGHGNDNVSLWNFLKSSMHQSCRSRSMGDSVNLLDAVYDFDPLHFGITPKEAVFLDPQQRMLLAATYRAMENAGLSNLPSSTGVFIGVSSSDFAQMAFERNMNQGYLAVGTNPSVLAGRLAHCFDLHGPALVLDTACSSASSALAIACDNLKNDICDFAIVGAVNLILNSKSTAVLKQLGVLSIDGHCHPFDVTAKGYARSEACAVLILKKVSCEEEFRGMTIERWAVGHDGNSAGLTVPNFLSQVEVMKKAFAPVSCIESHATGTALGDPIETQAIDDVYPDVNFIQSCKSQIGHCEAVAGLASMICVMQQLKYGYNIPLLHFSLANPKCNFSRKTLFIVGTEEETPSRTKEETPSRTEKETPSRTEEETPSRTEEETPSRTEEETPSRTEEETPSKTEAETPSRTEEETPSKTEEETPSMYAINCFGFSGTNTHVVVNWCDNKSRTHEQDAFIPIIVLSSRTEKQLQATVATFKEFFLETNLDLKTICTYLQKGCRHYGRRFATPILSHHLAGRFSTMDTKILDTKSLDTKSLDTKTLNTKSLDTKTLDTKNLDTKNLPFSDNAMIAFLVQEVHSDELTSFINSSIASRTMYSKYLALWKRVNGAMVNNTLHENFLKTTVLVFMFIEANVKPSAVIYNSKNYISTLIAAIIAGSSTFENACLCLQSKQKLTVTFENSLPIFDLQSIGLTNTTGEANISKSMITSWLKEYNINIIVGFGSDLQIEGLEHTFKEVSVLDNINSPALSIAKAFAQLFSIGIDIHWDRLNFDPVETDLNIPGYIFDQSRFCPFDDIKPTQLSHTVVTGTENDRQRISDQCVPCAKPHHIYRVDWLIQSSTQKAKRLYKWLVLSSDETNETLAAQPFVYKMIKLSQNKDIVSASWKRQLHDQLDQNLWVSASWKRQLHDQLEQNRQCHRLLFVWVEYECAERNIDQLWNIIEIIKIAMEIHSTLIFSVSFFDSSNFFGAVAGLLRSIALENGQKFAFHLIEVEAYSQLVREMKQETIENVVVAYRNGLRSVQRLVPFQHSPNDQFSMNFLMENVLITGGIGGIAQEILHFFKPTQTVLISSSSTPSMDIIRRWEKLTKQGHKIHFLQTDVADYVAMSAIFDQYGPFTTVIHCAGYVDNVLFRNMTAEKLQKVCRAKILGTCVLDRLISTKQTKRVILMSSSASLLGSVGQCNYAAANGFMDSYASRKCAQGQPWICLNWGPWAECGMLAGDELSAIRSHLMTDGYQFLKSESALTTLSDLMLNDCSQYFVCALDKITWEKKHDSVMTIFNDFKINEKNKNIPDYKEISSFSQKIDEKKCRKVILEIINEISGLETVDIDRGFMSLGIDSLMLNELSQRLSIIFDVKLASVALFDHSTVKTLASYIVSLIGDRSIIEITEPISPFSNNAVAIIGYSGAFSGSTSIDEFWKKITTGAECIQRFTTEQLIANGIDEKIVFDENFIPAAGVIPDIFAFDYEFWHLSYNDSVTLDPQIRCFVQHAYQALEISGHINDRSDIPVGIFVGAEPSNYSADIEEIHGSLRQLYGNNQKDFLAMWCAKLLNLHGTAQSVYSACSSSLLAIVSACNSLQLDQCEMALAGAASLVLPSDIGYIYQDGSMFSPDGRCRSMDNSANGTVRGSGVGVVVLKMLDKAIRDEDHVYAVIRGYGCTNDGKTSNFLAPATAKQAECITDAIEMAGIQPHSLQYIECHATGTKLGDAIELKALHSALGNSKCIIGSVKANIGHAFAASGLAGLLKICKMIENNILPQQINFQAANEELGSFEVLTESRVWNNSNKLAGLSSFGIGGTNAHLIISSPDIADEKSEDDPSGLRNFWILPISGNTEAACLRNCRKLAEYLHEDSDLNSIAYTLQEKREENKYRIAIIADSTSSARIQLEAVNKACMASSVAPNQIAFFFAPQGLQYENMGRSFLEFAPVFRTCIDDCRTIIIEETQTDINEILFGKNEKTIDKIEWAQICIFVISHAISKQLLAWGIDFGHLVGHSVGEYTAAVVDDALPLRDTLCFLLKRAILMNTTPVAGLLAISEQLAIPKNLHISAVLSDELYCVTGVAEDIAVFENDLAAKHIDYTKLRSERGFHSPLMTNIVQPLRDHLHEISMSEMKRDFVSNIDGRRRTKLNAKYWMDQMVKPVMLGKCLDYLSKEKEVKVILEIGPSGILRNLLNRNHPEISHIRTMVAKKKHEKGQGKYQLLQAVADLWTMGYKVDWRKIFGLSKLDTKLPPYQFQSSICHPPIEFKPLTNKAQKLYQPSWLFHSYVDSNISSTSSETVLVFGRSSDDCKTVVKDVLCILVTANVSLQGINRVEKFRFEINPLDESSYQSLSNALQNENIRPTMIVNTWNIGENKNENIRPTMIVNTWNIGNSNDEDDSLDKLLLFNFYCVFYINKHIVPFFKLNGFFVFLSNLDVYPERATVLGPLRLIPNSICIRLTDTEDTDYIKLSLKFATDPDSFPSSQFVMLMGRELWKKCYVEVHPKAEMSLRIGKVILIAGIGDVSRCFITEIITKSQTPLTFILVSRNATKKVKGDAWPALLLRCTESGHRMDIRDCELSIPENVLVLFQSLESFYGHIDTVINCAGIIAFSSLEQSKEDIKSTLRAKIHTTKNMLKAIEKFNIKIINFILTSSLTGQIGLQGTEHYAAANIYLDSIAEFVRCENVERFLSIQWPGWRQSKMFQQRDGMPLAIRDLLNQGSISNLEGGMLFSKCLQFSGIVAVSRIDPMLLKERIQSIQLPTQEIDHVMEKQDLKIILQNIWHKTLSIPLINNEDDFFKLGGDSLNAMQLIWRVNSALNVNCTVNFLFQNPKFLTFHHKVKQMLEGVSEASTVIPIADKSKPLPLTYSQESLFFLRQLDPSPRYNVLFLMKFVGRALNEKKIWHSLCRLIAQQTSLRTGFIQREDMGAEQTSLRTGFIQNEDMAAEQIIFSLTEAFYSSHWKRMNSTELIELIDNEKQWNYDLVIAPFRMILLKVDHTYQIIISHYHIITDGWSMSLFARQLQSFYKDEHLPTTNKDEHQPTTNKDEHLLTPNKDEHLSTTTNKDEHLPTTNKNEHLPTTNKNGHPPTTNKDEHQPTTNKDEHLLTPNKDEHLSTTTNKDEHLPTTTNKDDHLSIRQQINVADFAVWQRQTITPASLKPALELLKEKLRHGDRCTMPIMKKASSSEHTNRNFSVHEWFLEQTVSDRLHAFAKQLGYTDYTVLFATFALFLARLLPPQQSKDVVLLIGSPVSGRNLPQLKNLIGYFLNNVIIKLKLEDLEHCDLHALNKVRVAVEDALRYEHVPFHLIVEAVEDHRQQNIHPIFQIYFNYRHDLEHPSIDIVDVQCEVKQLTKNSVFDFSCTIDDVDGRIKVMFEYRKDGFHLEAIRQWAGLFNRILYQLISAGRTITDERKNLNFSVQPRMGNGNFQPRMGNGNVQPRMDVDIPRSNLRQIILLQSARTPSHIMFQSKTVTKNYEEYVKLALQYATTLQIEYQLRTGEFLCPDTAIPIVGTSGNSLLLILAVLFTGCAYVPIESEQPNNKINQILTEIRSPLVLIDQWKGKANINGGITLEELSSKAQVLKKMPKRYSNTAISDLAYIIYTSGSTGHPKGVCIPNSAIINFLISCIQSLAITSTSSVFHSVKPVFDVSVINIFASWTNGARLIVPIDRRDITHEMNDDRRDITHEMGVGKVTHCFIPSVLLNNFTQEELSNFLNLKYLMVGGESPNDAQINFLLTNGQRVTQIYGPTESTIWSLQHRCKMLEDNGRTIGQALINQRITLVDHFERAQWEHSVPRQLAISGFGLARGYFHRPELTERNFRLNIWQSREDQIKGFHQRVYLTGDVVNIDPIGNLKFHGRIDDGQFKIRGHRCEKGEIEEAIRKFDRRIRQIFILFGPLSEKDTDPILQAYIISDWTQDKEQDLRLFLRHHLSDWMIPEVIVFLSEMPLNHSDKVDRERLRHMADLLRSRRGNLSLEEMSTMTPLERQIAEIWQESLPILDREMRLDDDFFAIGGHSLLTFALRHRLNRTFNVDVQLTDIFDHPTIRRFAKFLNDHRLTSIVPIAPIVPSPIVDCSAVINELRVSKNAQINLFCIHAVGGTIFPYYPFVQKLPASINLYPIEYRVEYPCDDLIQLAHFYCQAIRRVQPDGPYFLIGHSLGGILCFEMARIMGKGLVPLVIMLDAWATDPMRLDVNAVREYLKGQFDHLPHSDRLLAGAMRLTEMLSRHRFTIADTRIVLFKAAELSRSARSFRSHLDEATLRAMVDNEWQRWSTIAVDVRMVAGDHETMLRSDNLALFADQLTTLLVSE